MVLGAASREGPVDGLWRTERRKAKLLTAEPK